MMKFFFVSAGCISLSMGILGIFLPLLPTTPFLLLSAACFLRGSEKIHKWLITHKIFGSYIRFYQKYRAVSIKSKIVSLVILWGTIGTTAVFFISLLYVRILLFIIAALVSIHILLLKTLTREMIEKDKEN